MSVRRRKQKNNRFGEFVCPYCKRMIGLQKSGFFRKHGKVRETCEGSWQKPEMNQSR